MENTATGITPEIPVKKRFYTELAYALGIIVLAIGAALMEKADFGVSMVVAPAYLVYLKLSAIWPFVTFGMAEYTLQALLLAAMIPVMRRFKVSWLFSFVTAVLYGLLLDFFMMLAAFLPVDVFMYRVIYYVVGVFSCAVGVSFVFHTYISPEVYDLFVKELSARYNLNINRVKTVYDCISCVAGIALSFAFFGLWHFEGVKVGTIICALVNGFLIGRISAFFEKRFDFTDALKLRRFFA